MCVCVCVLQALWYGTAGRDRDLDNPDEPVINLFHCRLLNTVQKCVCVCLCVCLCVGS